MVVNRRQWMHQQQEDRVKQRRLDQETSEETPYRTLHIVLNNDEFCNWMGGGVKKQEPGVYEVTSEALKKRPFSTVPSSDFAGCTPKNLCTFKLP